MLVGTNCSSRDSHHLADWGMSYVVCGPLGDRAQVLVDLGHTQGVLDTWWLSAERRKLGGFHFNNPNTPTTTSPSARSIPGIVLIFNELVDADLDPPPSGVAFMIDQATTSSPGGGDGAIGDQLPAYAKALLVNRQALRDAQRAGDIVGAEEELVKAYETDVEPLLRLAREEMGLEPDPLQAYRRSGYEQQKAQERAGITGGATLG